MAESKEEAVDRLIDERPGAELLLPRYDDPAHLVAAVHDLPADDSLPPPWLSHCVSHPDVLPAWPSHGLA